MPENNLPPPGHVHQIRRAHHLHVVRYLGKVDRLTVDVHGYVTDDAGRSQQARRDLNAAGLQGEGSGLTDSEPGHTYKCPDWEHCPKPLVSHRILTQALQDAPGCLYMPDPNRPWVKSPGRKPLPLHLIAPGQRTEGKPTDQALTLCGKVIAGGRLADGQDLAAFLFETETPWTGRPVCTYCLDELLGQDAVNALHARDRLALSYE